MSIETINDGGMMEALDELLEQFQNGGPDTKQRIAPVIVKRAKAAEGKLQSVKRNFWSAVCDLWSDEEADDLIARLMKRAEKRTEKRKR